MNCSETEKRHRQGFGRQWNMQQHCQKVHGGSPDQLDASTAGVAPRNPPLETEPPDASGSTAGTNEDLRNKLEKELEEAKTERVKTLQAMENKIEALRLERDTTMQRFDEKIKALENLIGVLGGRGR